MPFLPMVFWFTQGNMKRIVEVSDDGSTTLRVLDWDEPYHSKHGAIQESQHVFLKQGLHGFDGPEVRILEMGFGTGLNALLTFIYARKHGLKIRYTGLEAYPLKQEEWTKMNYLEQLSAEEFQPVWQLMHTVASNKWASLDKDFEFYRAELDVRDFRSEPQYHLIYYDAFGPRVQPDLWTVPILEKMYAALLPEGRLVTYCSKGSVRRHMQEVGFRVEKLEGPPGKREMLRAIK